MMHQNSVHIHGYVSLTPCSSINFIDAERCISEKSFES